MNRCAAAHLCQPNKGGGGGGEGRLQVTLTGDLKKCYIFLAGMSEKHSLYSSCQQTIGDVDLSLKIDFFF